jgi:DNA-directed RNA polymerase II subunit RPB1
MDNNIYAHDHKVTKINNVEFNILSNREILNISALGKETNGVSVADLYDNQEPKRGGLIDLRFGTTNNTRDCDTCGLNDIHCIGHFGHIKLEDNIFHMGYLQFVKKILGCICLKCCKILVYKNENEFLEMMKNKSERTRLTEVKNAVKNVTVCPHCKVTVSKIKLEEKKTTGTITLYSETELSKEEATTDGKKKIKFVLTPSTVYDILKSISDQDCILLGMDPKKSRPEEMIHEVFPIPPVQVRPSVRADHMASNLMEDDLTHKLADIIKANERIKHQNDNENATKWHNDNLQFLQLHVATYLDNDNANVPKSEQKGKITKSLGPRLKGKDGRVRGNLMGKRVDFSARTVITSDPTIEINQLGVPLKIAMNLTFREDVTPNNINFLTKLVKNGRDKYPGANFVFSSNASNQRMLFYDLRIKKDKIELKFGDVVERHLLDGDTVLLNRQPTLHKQSMMAHRVKVINNPNLNTFRLSPSVTPPYNADFDGDEMNIFVPETIQSMMELEEIADVKRQIISPASSLTSIGIVQDGLIGSYNMTAANMKIDWKNSMNIMSYTSVDDFNQFKAKRDYYGSELFSMIIPKRINLKNFDDKTNNAIVIQNGVLKSGQITNKLLGAKKKNNLTQTIWDEYGIDETKNFLNDAQRLANNFNLYNGFTVGIGDTFITDKVYQEINQLINTKDLKVATMITEYENNPDLMDISLFEKKIYSELNDIRNDASKIVIANFDPLNNFNIMSSCGSKGDSNNMGQIIACVGMQAFESNMMPNKYGNRTIPYFHRDADTSEARGLIKSPFRLGMTFAEMYYQCVASRSGVIDTAIKTADSGYVQRKLIKLMEDYKVTYDCTVRSATNQVIQFIYGDSGTDPTRQYEYNLKFLEMGNAEIMEKYLFSKSEMKEHQVSENDNENVYKIIKNLRDKLRMSQIKTRMNWITIQTKFMLAVNLNRIVESVKNNPDIIAEKSKLTHDDILTGIENILHDKNTQIFVINKKNIGDPKTMKYHDSQLAKTAFRACLFDMLSPKKCLLDHKLNKKQFDCIVENIIFNFNKNMVEPGEMIGVIAAQSMGECVTQLTLKSFDWHEIICVEIDANTQTSKSYTIGDFIETLMDNDCPQKIVDCKENEMSDTHYLDIKNKNYYINSVDEYGFVSRQLIEGVTKHLPVDKNGNTDVLLKVTLENGISVTATKGLSFLTMKNNKIVPTRGDALSVGDYLPIDGKNFSEKKISNNLCYPNMNFRNLQGNVLVLDAIEYFLENSNTFTDDEKNIVDKYLGMRVFFDKIVSIEEVQSSHKYVYDLTVANTRTFVLENGLCVMDSFHTAGIAQIKDTTQGMPRIKELLSLSKNIKTPQMIIFMNDEHVHNRDMAQKIASYIEYTTLGNLRKSVAIYYDPDPYAKSGFIEKDKATKIFASKSSTRNSCQADVANLPWLLRVELDREKLLMHEVTLIDIKSKLCHMWEKRYANTDKAKKDDKQVFDNVVQIGIMSNTDYDKVPIIHIRFDLINFDITRLNAFIDTIIDNFKLKGIPRIKKSTVNNTRVLRFDGPDQEIIKDDQCVVYALGVNLQDVRYLNNVNIYKTICNDVVEMYRIFGIEAARTTLLTEISLTYELGGQNVNYHHIGVLVDMMTFDGTLTSIDRHGMNKTDSGPLSRASFEKTVDILLTAAVFGEIDDMTGVSSRIMSGLVIQGGTGMCNVYLDTEMIKNSEYTEDIGQKYVKTYNEINKSSIIQDISNKDEIDDVFIPF